MRRLLPLLGSLLWLGFQTLGFHSLACLPALAADPGPTPRFSRLPWSAGLRAPEAAAFHTGPGLRSHRLAVGDASGVTIAWPDSEGHGIERVLRKGPVRDLAFDGEGVLWVASATGLFRVDGRGAIDEVRLGTGAADRDVARVVTAPGLVACATAGGVFVSIGGQAFEPIDIPRGGAASGLAASPGLQLLIAVEGKAYHWRGDPGPGTIVPLLPDPSVGRVLDVASHRAPDGRRLLSLLTARRLWRAELTASGIGAWLPVPLVPPPGAELARLFPLAGRDYVSSDRGLLVASGERLLRVLGAGQAGRILDVVGDDRVQFAVGDIGVLEARAPTAPEPMGTNGRGPDSSAGSSAPSIPAPGPASTPGIAAVHRAVLRHLDLGPDRMRRLWRGARRRGWLPTLELRGAYGGGRDQGHDLDQTFSSGEDRLFYDRDWGRSRDFDVAAVLRFDLGAIAYEPESIDVSREAREIIELRDDVLDEVNQMYFAWRRSLRQAAHPDTAPEESERLLDRADELAAGLDAWSGGWFRQAASGTRPGGWLRRGHDPSPPGPRSEKP